MRPRKWHRLGFRHDCVLPRARTSGRQWTCPACRRVWTLTASGGSSTDDGEGTVVAVLMRYPDGTEEVFRRRRDADLTSEPGPDELREPQGYIESEPM